MTSPIPRLSLFHGIPSSMTLLIQQLSLLMTLLSPRHSLPHDSPFPTTPSSSDVVVVEAIPKNTPKVHKPDVCMQRPESEPSRMDTRHDTRMASGSFLAQVVTVFPLYMLRVWSDFVRVGGWYLEDYVFLGNLYSYVLLKWFIITGLG